MPASTSTSAAPARDSQRTAGARFAGLICPAILPFVISRLAVLLVAVALAWLLDTGRAYRYDYVGDAPISTLSATFDANWYASIAGEGYSNSPNVAKEQNYTFFPLYPLGMRVFGSLLGLGDLHGGYNLAGVILSHIFFFVGLVALYWLTLRAFDDNRIASTTVWAAALSPWSFVFSMAYTESLFLALSVGAIALASDQGAGTRSGRFVFAAFLVALAALTRPQGIVLAVPVILLILFKERDISWRTRVISSVGVAAPAVLAIAAFFLFIGARTGNVLAPLQVNRMWGKGWYYDLERLFNSPSSNVMWTVDFLSTAGLIAWILVLLVQIRKLPTLAAVTHSANATLIWACLAFSVLCFTLTLLGAPANRSWGRYMVAVFPNIWGLAFLVHGIKGRCRMILAVVPIALQLFLFAAAILQQVTP